MSSWTTPAHGGRAGAVGRHPVFSGVEADVCIQPGRQITVQCSVLIMEAIRLYYYNRSLEISARGV